MECHNFQVENKSGLQNTGYVPHAEDSSKF